MPTIWGAAYHGFVEGTKEEIDAFLVKSIQTHRGCDSCFTGRGEFYAGIDREIIGGGGEECPVMLCGGCLARFKAERAG